MSKKPSAKKILDENVAKINTRMENIRATENATEAILEQLDGKSAEVRKLHKTKVNAKDINELKNEIQYLKSTYKTTLGVIKEWGEDWDELVNKYHELQILIQDYDAILQSSKAWQTKYFDLQLEKESLENELAEANTKSLYNYKAEADSWKAKFERIDKDYISLGNTLESANEQLYNLSQKNNQLTNECEVLKKQLADKERAYEVVEHNFEKVNFECAQWRETCDKFSQVLNTTADTVTVDSDDYNNLLCEVEELKEELADYKYIFHLLRTKE